MGGIMRRNRGVALIVVLWVVMLLTVIAGNFVFTLRTETLGAGNAVALAQAEAQADGAVHRALYAAFRPLTDAQAWPADGRWHEWTEADGTEIRVAVRDAAGKIDLNTASDALLVGLLQSVGVESVRAVQLVDAIADWRDGDELTRPHGAEKDEYRAAGLSYGPANAPFEVIEQVQQVLGMNSEIYARIAALITVDSHQPGVNPQVAPAAVLRAIPGVTTEQLETYLAQRQVAQEGGQPLPPFPAEAAYIAQPQMSVLNVVAQARRPDGTLFVRDAAARRGREAARPVEFLSWQEGRALQEGSAP